MSKKDVLAAQADYEQRIMAAIEFQSSDVPMASRLVPPGPSEAIADVSVDELAFCIGQAVVDDCKTKPGSAWLDGLAAAARALLSRYKIERLDRLASSERK